MGLNPALLKQVGAILNRLEAREHCPKGTKEKDASELTEVVQSLCYNSS